MFPDPHTADTLCSFFSSCGIICDFDGDMLLVKLDRTTIGDLNVDSNIPGLELLKYAMRKHQNFSDKIRPHADGKMKRSRYDEEKSVLREQAGAKTVDLTRKNDVSEGTFYTKNGEIYVSEAEQLKQLKHENAKLKKLLVVATVDASALRKLLIKKT